MARRIFLAAAIGVFCLLVVSGCGSSGDSAADAAGSTRQTGGDVASPASENNLPDSISASAQAAALSRFAAKHRPVFCGGRAKPWVAFTFDDGPGPYTKNMVGILQHFRVPATWFLVGRNVGPYKSSMHADERRGPIGDHSWSHPLLTSLPTGEVRSQIVNTADAIDRGGAPRPHLFRPPYGAHDRRVDEIARSQGMVQILWNIDSRDALGANYKQISRNVIAGLHPGSIILMHENRGQTIRALRYTVLPHLKKHKMQLVTVPQMLAGNPPTAAQLARGRKGCR